MAITFPRDLPLCGFVQHRFELQRVDYLSPESRGRIGAIGAGVPLWAATYQLPRLKGEAAEAVRAWVRSLRGASRLFYGRDPARGKLQSGDAGAVSAWSVDAARTAVTLTTVAGLRVLPGDHLGFNWTTAGVGRAALVSVVEGGTANQLGALALAVEPAVPLVIPTNAAATFSNPRCLMRLTPETDMGDTELLRFIAPRLSAVQELLP